MMNITGKKYINEIINVHRNAFRGLHVGEGYDFEKPFNILKYEGRFTLNQVKKDIKANGILPEDNKIMLLIGYLSEETEGKRKHGELYAVQVLSEGFIISETKRAFIREDCERFWRKSDFEDLRKSGLATTYVIIQDWQFIKYPERKPSHSGYLNEYERVKITYRPEEGYNGYTLNFIDWNVTQRKYSVPEELDKSGYNVENARDNLYQKVRKIKADKEKADYLKQDNSHKITAISELIKGLKKQVISDLENAETYDEVKEVTRKLDHWRGYKGILNDFETFKKRTENKEYCSIESSELDYNNLMKEILNYAEL